MQNQRTPAKIQTLDMFVYYSNKFKIPSIFRPMLKDTYCEWLNFHGVPIFVEGPNHEFQYP